MVKSFSILPTEYCGHLTLHNTNSYNFSGTDDALLASNQNCLQHCGKKTYVGIKCVHLSAQISHLVAAFQLEAAQMNRRGIVIRRQTAA